MSFLKLLPLITGWAAVGVLIPIGAQAYPPSPLEPPCAQYKFIGDYALDQSNGFRVEFSSNDAIFVRGRATAAGRNGAQMFGTIRNGGIKGRHLDFIIDWDSGSRG